MRIYSMIKKILEPNEAILEIAVVGTAPENIHMPENIGMKGILVLLLPQGNPIVTVVNFHPLIPLTKEWPQKLNEVITCSPLDAIKRARCQQEADIIGRKICDILFPEAIKNIINGCKVDFLFQVVGKHYVNGAFTILTIGKRVLMLLLNVTQLPTLSVLSVSYLVIRIMI